jgi:hypothetical protein
MLDQIRAMVALLVAGNHFVFAADTHNNKTAVSCRHTQQQNSC